MKRAVRQKLEEKQMELLAFAQRPRIIPAGYQICGECGGLLKPISGGSFRHVTNEEARACDRRVRRK